MAVYRTYYEYVLSFSKKFEENVTTTSIYDRSLKNIAFTPPLLSHGLYKENLTKFKSSTSRGGKLIAILRYVIELLTIYKMEILCVFFSASGRWFVCEYM